MFDRNLRRQADHLIEKLRVYHPDVVINCIVDFDYYNNYVVKTRIDKELLKGFKISESDHLSALTYARLFLGRLVKSDFVLYLDVDILIQSSLCELLELRPSESIAWCSHASSSHEIRLSKYGFKGCYMQAGVFIANLRRWREQRVEERFLEFGALLGENAIMWDQDILNLTFQTDSKIIGQRFNVFRRIHNGQYQSAVIIHYDGADKPWHWGSTSRVNRLWRDANVTFVNNYVSRGVFKNCINLLRNLIREYCNYN